MIILDLINWWWLAAFFYLSCGYVSAYVIYILPMTRTMAASRIRLQMRNRDITGWAHLKMCLYLILTTIAITIFWLPLTIIGIIAHIVFRK